MSIEYGVPSIRGLFLALQQRRAGGVMSKLTARGTNRAEAQALQRTPVNGTAKLMASGSLTMMPVRSTSGLPAAAGMATEKAIDTVHEVRDKLHDR